MCSVEEIISGGATAQVVSLGKIRVAMKHPAMAQVEAYWEGLRGGRPIPFRSEVDPRGIDRALENAFILERIAPGVARFRLAGMHLNDLMGMEVRGMPVTSFFTPEARRKIGEALEHLFEEPAKIRFSLIAETGIGKPPLRADMLLMPLKSDLGDVSRAIGCLVSDGKIGRTPRRFDVEEVDVTHIDDMTTFDDDEAEIAVPTPAEVPATVSAQPGFSEPAKSYGPAATDSVPPAARPVGERPYLRLIHSTDSDD